MEDFKIILDQYLQTIPDEPTVNGLTPRGMNQEAESSNSLLHQKAGMRTDH